MHFDFLLNQSPGSLHAVYTDDHPVLIWATIKEQTYYWKENLEDVVDISKEFDHNFEQIDKGLIYYADPNANFLEQLQKAVLGIEDNASLTILIIY